MAEKSKTKFLVLIPNAGSIIEKSEKKDTPEEWYPIGAYIMTETEKTYSKNILITMEKFVTIFNNQNSFLGFVPAGDKRLLPAKNFRF